ncbi:odorant receptor Or2-like [Bombyx mandarina]|uniref:Odorant receptor n=2 Tax=Bombyx TaxID=7090 RepID=C4B7Y4_BOMMO|nr:olfactory receptor 56 [Bombyx mori]XP_028040278.1 odorant receptor Or2-like [Bombyx mandarina]BAH66350.1 olfactory receptor [Bombyx mori]
MKLLEKLEDPDRPLLGPNVKALKFWGLLLPESRSKKYFYLFMHFAVTVFTATEYIDVWFVKSDLALLLNNLKITMLATVSVLKVTTFLLWQNAWRDLIGYVSRADLEQRATSDSRKLALINGFTGYCRKITYYYWFLMYTTVAIVTVQPIFKFFSSAAYRLDVQSGNGTYLQVVSSWIPWDKNTLPGYLLASIYQTYAAIYGGGWITSFDTNAIVIMVFFRAELELLRIDCAALFDDEKSFGDMAFMRRLKECHRRHTELVKHSRLFDSCLSPIMLLYMFVCSVMLCVTAYQITIETNPMERFLMTEYLVFGVAQLFMYCWHSNDVLYASQDLSRGPYESAWWSRDVKYRKNLYILVAQFNKVIVFSAGPFTKLTVATFIRILKGAYSYYTLLSQSQMNKT